MAVLLNLMQQVTIISSAIKNCIGCLFVLDDLKDLYLNHE